MVVVEELPSKSKLAKAL